jgi:hypothetical protein
MSWIGGACQGNRRYECNYMTWDTYEGVCLDSDEYCWSMWDRAGLVSVVDHQAPPPPPSGGGGW